VIDLITSLRVVVVSQSSSLITESSTTFWIEIEMKMSWWKIAEAKKGRLMFIGGN
jgi:hypothetical protein